MTKDPNVHRQAARRHEEAASNHDRSATFWDSRGMRDQAGLQRDLADYERQGAELERQWADMVDPSAVDRAAKDAEGSRAITRKNAERLSSQLRRTADALEQAADVAEQHARRHERLGHSDGAGEERKAAARALNYAEMARKQAEEWRRLASRATDTRPLAEGEPSSPTPPS